LGLREEGIGDGENYMLHNWYFSTNNIKSGKIKGYAADGHTSRMGKMRNFQRNLVGNG
jgi:hypothetical protein